MISEVTAEELTTEIEALQTHPRFNNKDITVESRICESDVHQGVSLYLKGETVPLRPVIERIGRLENWKIESISMVSDASTSKCPTCENEIYEKCITLFCAYMGEEDNYLSDVFAKTTNY